jgi:16S rRNA (guanine1207-N2)-methyltransferase
MTATLLFHPFEKGLIAPIKPRAICAAIECDYVSAFDNISDLKIFNSFKPQAHQWNGYQAAPMVADTYDYIFLQVPKQKIAAKALIAKALQALSQGGHLICLAANDAGGKTLERSVKIFGANTQSLSKSKHRIVVAQKNRLDKKEIDQAIEEGAPQHMAFEGDVYVTRPGIFGWNKIDRGSHLLLEHIEDGLIGNGADFGCGYGYLSCAVLNNHAGIKEFYAIDADIHALECARENLKDFNVTYLWEDLTDFSLSGLDWIVMNPPFHEGKKSDHDIGMCFIKNAAASLKKDGALFMVANHHLPYEKFLEAYFSHIDKVKEQDGFKVFRAVK